MRVGDYVRTKDGYIDKIVDFKPITKYTKYNTLYLEHKFGEQLLSDSELKDIKSSPNIIDLIEVGDYVNGCIVINKNDDTIQVIQLIIPFDLKEKDIKSIVTKEQFSAMEYKVESEVK